MNKTLGVIGIVLGVLLGLYIGVWIMFVGGIIGIVNFIEGIVNGNTDGMLLAISIVKIIFAGLVGTLSAYMFILPSFALIGNDTKKYKTFRKGGK